MLMVRYAQRGSAIFQEVAGESGRWGESEHLLAIIADTLHAANWQRGGDSNAQRPLPLQRPGQEQEHPEQSGVVHVGADAVTADEFSSWWDMEVESSE